MAVARPPDKVQQELEEARRARQAAAEEASRLRAEAEGRRKADEEAALRRKIEDEIRQKAEAEQAARQKAEDAAKAEAAKAEAARAEAAKAEADRTRAEAQKAEAQKKPPPPAQVATSSAAPRSGPLGRGSMRRVVPVAMVSRRLSGLSGKLLVRAHDHSQRCDFRPMDVAGRDRAADIQRPGCAGRHG